MEQGKKSLVLIFETAAGKNLEITISKPKEGLDALDIKDAMDAIVETGAFGSTDPASKVVGAQYEFKQIEKVTLA